jgi:hypothetical protein
VITADDFREAIRLYARENPGASDAATCYAYEMEHFISWNAGEHCIAAERNGRSGGRHKPVVLNVYSLRKVRAGLSAYLPFSLTFGMRIVQDAQRGMGKLLAPRLIAARQTFMRMGA